MKKINCNTDNRQIRIGTVKLLNPIFLAPMAGVTDLPFRIICKELGCGLVYTEMISAKGVIHNNINTVELLKIEQQEKPVAVQFFGSEPGIMAQAAKLVAKAGADVIDINMGCPMPKIVKNGDGSALMLRPLLAYEIMASVVEAVSIPITVKIRKGWDDNSVNAVEMAILAQKAGIAAVAVHGRTREQLYTGKADWDIIRTVKESVKITVIGNGDVRSPEDAKRMLLHTGCDAVMIGRGCQGNPWIFSQVAEYLQSGSIPEAPTIEERLKMIFRHIDSLIEHKGQYRGIREIRSHAAWYTKGLRNAAEIRVKLNKAETRNDFIEILEGFKVCRC